MFKRSLLAAMLAIAFTGCSSNEMSTTGASQVEDGDGGQEACVFTQGYWKNHPDAWPVDSLLLGSTSYTQDELLAIFHTPVKGNGLISLAHQLIAAKLNVANGGATSISGAIGDADALIFGLVVPPIGDGYLAPSQTSALVGRLDGYNNDGECASQPSCGDGHVDSGEQCDDGNTTSGDGCSETCTTEPPPPSCGDGHVDAGEGCDDGNTTSGDGCSSTCQCECPPEPACGDGHVDAGEQCDDGNTANGDGCSSACTTEEPPPGVCGDGHLDAGEGCDDGNTVDGDGCSSTCQCEGTPQLTTIYRAPADAVLAP